MSSTTGVRGTSASLPREADSQEEGGSRRHDSFRRRARDAPIDPRLYQHLERLGLGCEGRTRHKKLRRQEKRKKLSEEELLRIEKQVTREAIPYFQQVTGEPPADIVYSSRDTSSGKYRSLTIHAPVKSADQLYEIYEKVDLDPRVKFKF
ncbi:hypothetical protein NSK_001818 [Nannochloropsis salina CCMP1776]|uniref:Uncharacterized protein n=1 Tax=Nannochloropsis salina CCMP1776 TaxID=1027361 RepID=A0A4D9D5K1_9STRA|nr:hypothetical protein NSK_001818 [Nannochloropsis salina CCMP1776]|eukprot:TFJ86730.1 hypothetical protein NSK_001818 [Nannochloropsis salina CCMP1776]